MAVAFFFVLGGFALTLGYKDKVIRDDFSYKAFIKKRCIKFYPLHWLCLLVAVPFVILHFKWWQIPNFAINALLLQTWIPIQPVYFSFNAVSWYLANTLFFALIFPWLFRLVINFDTRKRIWMLVVMAVFYTTLIVLLPTKYYHAILYINPLVRTIDFVIGMYIALCFGKLKDNAKIQNVIVNKSFVVNVVIVLLVASLILISNCLDDDHRTMALFYWLPICMLILIVSLLGCCNAGGYLQTHWLVTLGECSFEIFMIHQLVIRYCQVLFCKILHIDNTYTLAIVALIITIVASYLVHKTVTKNISLWLTKKILPSMTVR